ncbi:hypothetical protein LUZ63_004767 [Rhynchospora breviuscula]|uniref:F-box domain-containing protein n=1 Tax=Rhynchospora breviuscula TaxID=2022672 RepID=A0A9Q0HSF6_9POAL|nr:hypothetical protein LUZ63_004767 [Rhynchospora breviuscula]
MGESSEFKGWEELIPDALGLIFRNLSLQDRLTVVPRVCKSWCRAVSGPYSWQEIDIEEWSKQCEPDKLERMLHLLFSWSGRAFHRLCVSGLPNDSLFSLIADHAGSLKTLELPRSQITDSMVEQVAPRLAGITFLDVSYCTKMGPRALEAFGRSCRSLVGLRRRMYPLAVADKESQDEEAHAIASTMPKLRHLETAYLLLSTAGVVKILSNCRELELLDVRGCWEVKLDEKVVTERYGRVKVLGPDVVDHCYERNLWEECSDSESVYSWETMDEGDFVLDGGSDEEDGIWDDGDGLENLELRFYGGGPHADAFAGFHWPPSP